MDNLNTPYNSMLRFDSIFMSDYEASIQLNHKAEKQTTHICQKDGVDLYLCGHTLIQDNTSGQYFAGNELFALIHTDVKATKQELIAFLQGEDIEAFSNYSVVSAPHLEWQERDGETVGDVFDTIPRDILLLQPA